MTQSGTQSKQEPKHMGKSKGQRLWESIQRSRREDEMREVNALAECLAKKLREQPDHESTGDASEHLQDDGNDKVHEVLPTIAVCPAGERDELNAHIFVLSEGDIAKLFKLVNDGEVTRDISSQLAILGNLGKSAFYPVEGLKGVKNSLLLSVESYKALLVCHAILLVLTVVALVAMARA